MTFAGGGRLEVDAVLWASAITVEIGRDADALVVEVTDDGVGGATVEDGSGLHGLRDRLATAGGAIAVESAPGAGTRVRAHVPVASG
ncbi:MAG TPA: hypothetical protein VN213_11940 [Solirubrobacteraceae bacterium]|nr:hypothetical protein [Solirubrobacteraceae bacterium]